MLRLCRHNNFQAWQGQIQSAAEVLQQKLGKERHATGIAVATVATRCSYHATMLSGAILIQCAVSHSVTLFSWLISQAIVFLPMCSPKTSLGDGLGIIMQGPLRLLESKRCCRNHGVTDIFCSQILLQFKGTVSTDEAL